MPASIRDFLGSKCPTCKNDILQAAQTTNRMPGQVDLASCPSCHATHSLEQLTRGAPRPTLLGKLFSKPQRT